MMKKTKVTTFLRRFICCALVLAMLPLSGLSASAAAEYTRDVSVKELTVTAGSNTVSGVYSDPVGYYDMANNGTLENQEIRYNTVNDGDTVLYTARYPKTTTGRTGVTEYVCEPDGSAYKVTAVNSNGDSYIPVGGFVLSMTDAAFAQVGDVVTLGGDNLKKLSIPTKAVESSSGKRIAVDTTNANRSGSMVVYYDYQFGSKTGTNVFGTEMTCTYDFDANSFKVVSFRGFGEGDDSGSEIPENSFVLSAYGEGYRGLLVAGQLFAVGDEVKMVGFDFIRFGGTVKGEFDFINPTEEMNPAGMEAENQPFPAYRGTNQTIVYKDGWKYNDADGTGTNVYGYEAAVDADGVVVELGVNVSKIPEGGYVLSGHGTGRDFIRSNMVLGATVVLDEDAKTYTITTTLNSYYENVVTEVENTIKTAETRIKQLYDIDSDTVQGYIDQAKAALEELKTVKEQIEAGMESAGWTEQQKLSQLMNYNKYQLQVQKYQQLILTTAAESKTVSARGVWHRPIESTYAEIEENIKLYSELGINIIFVETLYNGYSTFKTDSAVFPYNPKLPDNYNKDEQTPYADYLSAFVACCQAYGIEVHAWVENFYVGTQADVPVVTAHPDWVMYNDDGTIYQRNEGGSYIFLDPANKEVQDALIEYYLDLFAKVPGVAGLNLDYIRYPVTTREEDSGYTLAAMQAFVEKMGWTVKDSVKSDRTKLATTLKNMFSATLVGEEKASANYDAWVDFRAQTVTDYVRRVKTEVKDTKNILLSTSVFSDPTEVYEKKKQDWKTWFTNGWIDISTPMAYYTAATDVLTNVDMMISVAGNICYYYTGLASSYSGLPAWQNKEQIEASYSAGANGYVIFCSTQIIGHDDVQQVLLAGVNSSAAVLPHAELSKVIAAYFDNILDRATRIYIPKGGMDQTQYDALKAKFEEIKAMPCETAEQINAIKNEITVLYHSSIIKNYAKGYSQQRIVETLKEMEALMDTRVSVALVSSGQWDPEQNPDRPQMPAAVIPEQNVTVTEPTEPAPTEPVAAEPEETSFTGLWIALGVAVAVMAATGVAMVLMAKKKKPEDQE